MPASPTRLLVSITRAGLKATAAKLRGLGATPTSPHWTTRAGVCERCPLLVRQCGRSYCGKPFLRLPVRDPAVDGCGCPTRAKAQDPAEHCPITPRHRPAAAPDGACDCKWCVAVVAETASGAGAGQIPQAA